MTDPADLLPFNQALVEMLGELNSPFAYWQSLALARVCGGNGVVVVEGPFFVVVKKLHR